MEIDLAPCRTKNGVSLKFRVVERAGDYRRSSGGFPEGVPKRLNPRKHSYLLHSHEFRAVLAALELAERGPGIRGMVRTACRPCPCQSPPEWPPAAELKGPGSTDLHRIRREPASFCPSSTPCGCNRFSKRPLSHKSLTSSAGLYRCNDFVAEVIVTYAESIEMRF